MGSESQDFAILSPHRHGFQLPKIQQKPLSKKITLRLNGDEQDSGSFEFQSGSDSDDPDSGNNIEINITLRNTGSRKINVDQEKFAKAIKEFKQAVDKATDIDEEAKKPGENVFALQPKSTSCNDRRAVLKAAQQHPASAKSSSVADQHNENPK